MKDLSVAGVHARQPNQLGSRGGPSIGFAPSAVPPPVFLANQPKYPPDAGGYINRFCSICRKNSEQDPEFCGNFLDGFVQVRLACGSACERMREESTTAEVVAGRGSSELAEWLRERAVGSIIKPNPTRALMQRT